jgi:hypothetical protein
MLQCLTSPAWLGLGASETAVRFIRVLIRTHRIPNRTRVHDSAAPDLGRRAEVSAVVRCTGAWRLFDVCKHSMIALSR